MHYVTIRQYRDEDEQGIIPLLNTVFNGWPGFDLQCTDYEHWEWKFKDNPLKRNLITVAEHDNRIIGVMESIYLHFKIGSRIYLGRVGYDNAIHPDFQGKGLYTKINEFRRALPEYTESKVSVNTTENPKVIAHYTKRGLLTSFPKKIHTYVKIGDIGQETKDQPLPERIKNLLGFYALNTVNKVLNKFTDVIDDKVQLRPIESFTDEITPFISKMYERNDFIFERSIEYLNWRYCDLRGGKYKIIQAHMDNRIIGYIVCRVSSTRKGELGGYIIDLLVDPDYPYAAYSLLETGLGYIQEFDVNFVSAWVTQGHWLAKVFSQNGFLNSHQEVGIYLSPKEIGEDKVTVLNAPPDRLHLQIGDTDWI